MKAVFFIAALSAAAIVGDGPALAGCNACNIQTKSPAPNVPGMFIFHIVCIDDSSGDEIASNITAANEDEALKAGAAKCN